MSRSKKVTKTTTTTTTKTTSGGSVSKTEIDKYDEMGLIPEEINELKQAFALFDKDGSGSVDKDELMAALSKLGISNKNSALNKIMDDLDADKSGTVEVEEFVGMMTIKPPEKETKEGLEKVFNLYLGDDLDDLDFDSVSKLVKELGLGFTDDEVRNMIAKADTNRDGKVTFDEFYNIITKRI